MQRAVGNAAVVQLLRRAGHAEGGEHDAPERAEGAAVRDVLAGPGRPLDGARRAEMEGRLGADFSDVRIHDDSAARSSAAGIGARAYTSGSHVVLGDGGGDKHTLAHELTHVIQQRQGPVTGSDDGSGLKVSDPADRFEREAEANAARAMAGPAPDRAGPVGHHGGGPTRPGPVTVARLTSAAEFKEQSRRPGKTSQLRSRGKELKALDNLLDKYPGIPDMGAPMAEHARCAAALEQIRAAADAALAKDLKPEQTLAVRALREEAVTEHMVYAGLSGVPDATGVAELVRLTDLYDHVLPHAQSAVVGSDLSRLLNHVTGELTRRLGNLLDTVRAGGPGAEEADAVLKGAHRREMEALVRMAQDPTLPRLTRDILTEVTSLREMVTLSQGTPGTTKAGPGDYRMKNELGPPEGRVERLGALAHELTHVAAGESYRNTSILLLCRQGLGKQEMLHLAKERAGQVRHLKSLVTDDMVTGRQHMLLDNKLDYMVRPTRLAGYVMSFKEQLKAEIGEERHTELMEIAHEEMADSATLVEFDTVLTQLLVFLHSWNVPESHPFYQEVQRLARVQRNSRLSAMTG
ncbi:DUF4157 domain-containing protein [Streptomyces sp. HNM0574]|uniref:eCIS core domain-containing protein n=1 Tax=Streptomyces sp. HNM0574 TaxID=2714954 RepID=UPI001F0D4DF5|nr:DUF4157 domain-containing protein [Streptomyces sp. HNM0574]